MEAKLTWQRLDACQVALDLAVQGQRIAPRVVVAYHSPRLASAHDLPAGCRQLAD